MFAKITTASLAALFACAPALAGPALAGDVDHRDLVASVSTYGPMQGFNHIVGDKQFVGYFLTEADACAVTVFKAKAHDEELKVKPVKISLTIPAADRAEFEASDGSVLAIGCTVDADAIKVVPLTRPVVTTASAEPRS